MGRDFAVCLMRALYNQSPSKSQIALAKKEARKDAIFELKQKTDYGRVECLEKELKAYKELKERFKFWSGGDVERAMVEFERYRNLKPEDFIRALERIKDITNTELKKLRNRKDGS